MSEPPQHGVRQVGVRRVDVSDDNTGWWNQKRSEIIEACRWRAIDELRMLAESSGGFLTDDLRQLAWPVLLGLPFLDGDEAQSNDGHRGEDKGTPSEVQHQTLAFHKDEDQVQLDVQRSFIYYPKGQSEDELRACKTQLLDLILEVLRQHPYLRYFQGYHDICQVFMLVLPPKIRADALARLSVLRIRDFMLPSLRATTAQLRLLPDILAQADPELRRHVATIEPFYALSGTLTMYAHNIEGYNDIARLFDVSLAREPVFSLYVFAQIVLDRRDEVLDIEEPDLLQVVLSKIPQTMDLDALVPKAVELFDRYPPETLPFWRRISTTSVLKTARDVPSSERQSLDQGRAYFNRQVVEMRWAEQQEKLMASLWRHRRPLRVIGMTVVVAVVAMYLKRKPYAVHYIVSLLTR